MTALTARLPVQSTPPTLDMELVRQVLFYFGIACIAIAPLVRDPIALAVGGAIPWLLASILARTEIPGVVFYFLMAHWMQVVTRLIISWSDNESLADSIWGPELLRAYWYSLISIVVLALGLRVGFSGLKRSRVDIAAETRKWGLGRLFALYLGTLVLSLVALRLAGMGGGLAQPLSAVAGLRQSALFLLFFCALSSGAGTRWVAIAMVVEIGVGFSGIFADFKTSFVILALAALAARPVLRPITIVSTVVASLIFMVLLLFWTGIKAEYRAMSTGYSGSQQVTVDLGERAGFLFRKAISPSEMDWADNADQLVRRIAYIDFFASTISATETSPELRTFGNWSDVFMHVLRPRLLFPDKDVVDDSAVLQRIARVDAGDDRAGTSISVGYLAENFVDFGFPMMLAPMFGLGIFVALAARYFLSRRVAWPVCQAFALAVVLSCSYGTGVTLIKLVAPVILHSILFAIILKFVWPMLAHWLPIRDSTAGLSSR